MANIRKTLLRFFDYIKAKKFLLPYFLISAGLTIPLAYAKAATIIDWFFKAIIGGMIYLLGTIWLFVIGGLLSLFSWLLRVVANPNFVTKKYLDISFVREGWLFSFNLAGIFIIIALIAIGVSVALKMTDAKKALLRFFWSVVWIPLTPVIAGFVIDFSNIFVFTFFSTGAADGIANSLDLVWAWTEIFRGSMAFDVSIIDGVSRLIIGFIILTIFTFQASKVLYHYLSLFFARYVAFWLIIMLAPLAFACNALAELPDLPYFGFFKKLKMSYLTWWEQLMRWAFFGVFGSMFLYLAGRVSVAFLKGSEKNLFNTTDIGVSNGLLSISLNPGVLLTLIIGLEVPIIIMRFGYKLTMDWAPSGADAIIQAANKLWEDVKSAIKTAAMLAIGAAAGAPAIQGAAGKASAGLNAPTAGAPGAKATTGQKFSFWARDSAKKTGQKLFNKPLDSIQKAGSKIEAERKKKTKEYYEDLARVENKASGMKKGDLLARAGKRGLSKWFQDESYKIKLQTAADNGVFSRLNKEDKENGWIILGYDSEKAQKIMASIPETARNKMNPEKLKFLFSKEGMAGNIADNDLTNLNEQEKQQVKDAHQRAKDETNKGFKKVIAKGLKEEVIAGLDKSELLEDTNVQALGDMGNSNQMAALFKRGGGDAVTKLMDYLGTKDNAEQEARLRDLFGRLNNKNMEGLDAIADKLDLITQNLLKYSNRAALDQAGVEFGPKFYETAIEKLNQNFEEYAQSNPASLYWAASNPAVTGNVQDSHDHYLFEKKDVDDILRELRKINRMQREKQEK